MIELLLTNSTLPFSGSLKHVQQGELFSNLQGGFLRVGKVILVRNISIVQCDPWPSARTDGSWRLCSLRSLQRLHNVLVSRHAAS